MRKAPGDRPEDGLRAMLPAIGFAVLTLAASFIILNPQYAEGEVGLVFPPWVDQSEIYAAVVSAGGRILGASRLPNVVIAYAPDAAFHDRVRGHGAWFAVSASALCAAPEDVERWGTSA